MNAKDALDTRSGGGSGRLAEIVHRYVPTVVSTPSARMRQLIFIGQIFLLSRLIICAAIAASPWFYEPAPTHSSLGDPFLRPLFQWDTGWYLSIALHGYSYNGDPTQQQNVAFYPLYPLTCRLCHLLTGLSIPWCAVILSNGAFVIGLTTLYTLTTRDLGAEVARLTVLFVAFFPTSFFFSTMYTEAFFFLFSVLACTAFRRQRFIQGGLWAGLASATRPPGVLLGIPLLFEGVAHLNQRRLWWRVLLGGLCTVCGLGAFMLYLAITFHDPFASMRLQQAIGWNHGFAWPFTSLAGGLLRTVRSPLSPAPFDAWSSLLFIGLAWMLPAQLRRRYALYMVLAIAIPLCTKAGIVSLSRFVSVLFPGFMALGLLVQRRKWLYWLCLAVFTIALMKFSMRFATGRWVG